MKRIWFYILLVTEAVLCVIAAFILSPSDAGGVIAAQQIPFAQIGDGLRSMSLSGAVGNAFAIVLYIAVCGIPAAFLLVKLIRKRAKAEDALLAVMSGYLFYLMYMMINPGNIGSFGLGSESLGKAVLGGVFWSMLIGWLVLKLLRFVKGRDTTSLLKMMGVLFALAAVLLVFYTAYIAAYKGYVDLKADIKMLDAYSYVKPIVPSLIEGEISLLPSSEGINSLWEVVTYSDPIIFILTKVFFVFRYILGLIPYVLDVLIFLMAVKLTEHLRKDRYGTDAVKASEKLASLCKFTVVSIVLSSIAVNLLQVVFCENLQTMNFNNTIPLGSLILSLGTLLLSRYFAGSRKLKQENEAFV